MKIEIKNFGPISKADITLGDLNVTVGPQASGKSLFWQLLKLVLDAPAIRDSFHHYNFDWGRDVEGFLGLYFGEGMEHLNKDGVMIRSDGHDITIADLSRPKRGRKKQDKTTEIMFYIPAQRVMAIRDGLTRSFLELRAGDPFVVRDFSDKLHRLVQVEFAHANKLFPQENRLNQSLRRLIDDAFFRGFSLDINRDASFQKRLVLQRDDIRLPFMAWSAGQREFAPLLLGLYWLLPAGRVTRRDNLSWVVIEEPEMGLHPKAISAFMALVLELLSRDYRVCLSTHSPNLLDFVWALQTIKTYGGNEKDVLRLFNLPSNNFTKKAAQNILKKTITVHYFKPEDGVVDISTLDPGSDLSDVAGWGGLTEFTANVGDVVADVVNRSMQEQGSEQ
jgi:hypothetical protein